MDLSGCFKAYDVRGRVPGELNPESVYRIGCAYAAWLRPKRVAVGRDIRHSSRELSEALIRGLNDSGVSVVDIGLCGTEGVYFATFSQGLDGGIMVTASHNPPDYNGLKFVREESRPISGDTGLQEIRQLAEAGKFTVSGACGSHEPFDISPSWREHLLGYVDRAKLKPLAIVANSGNGGAGIAIDLIESDLPYRFTKVYHEPDGDFPHGVPNPMIEESRAVTGEAVRKHRADFGIAFDGDFDRCFFFDEQGRFIEGYYIVGLLASNFLAKYPGASILYEPRLVWNTLDIVQAHGGKAVICKSGHAFMKAAMRAADAVYGGETSAHHYFREFSYCDSGMIPWLVMGQLLSEAGRPLSTLVDERIRKFPSSGEINRKIADQQAAIDDVKRRFVPGAVSVESIDGLSVAHERWRFNLRTSNTEPLVRLNVESRGDAALMRARTAEILEVLSRHA
ncbi:MAG: phosphomannomutase [Gammaproteobacteria bacterium]|nr:phosphomannomutase [Gammaproteobacteria bacterium]